MNLPNKKNPGDRPGFSETIPEIANLACNVKNYTNDFKRGEDLSLAASMKSSISAIRYVLNREEYALISSSPNFDLLHAVYSGIRTSAGPRYRSIELRILIETAFQTSAEEALLLQPEEVVKWLSWSFRNDTKPKNRENNYLVKCGAYNA